MSVPLNSLFADVAGNTTQTAETVIPDGEVWEIQRFSGAAPYLSDVKVKLVWDHGGASPEVLAATHGDASIKLVKTLTGDGAKKLALVLKNDAANEHTIGGTWEGVHIE